MGASQMHPNDGHMASNSIVQALRGEDMTIHQDDVVCGLAA
jgi:hypothetical protein